MNRPSGFAFRLGAIGIVAAMLSLAGCVSIPTSGPVQAGPLGVVSDDDVVPIPPEIPEYDSVRLVEGFLKASAAGVGGDFSDVRKYLLDSVAQEWDPTASVTIYGSGDFTSVWDEEAQTVTYSLPVVATLDAAGRMTEAAPGTRSALTFGVTPLSSSRWRISSLSDGIVISEANFALVYRPVVLPFASRDGGVIVPDLRWLPRTNIATYATLSLINGPSAWLRDAVETGLQPTASLEVDTVRIEDALASVALASGSSISAGERSLAQEQFEYLLESLPDIDDVSVTVGGLPLGGDGSVNLVEAPVPEPRAAAIVAGRIGIWAGDEMMVPASRGVVPAQAHDLALSFDGTTVAMLIGAGSLATATIPPDLVPLADVGSTSSALPVQEVLNGNHLVAPSFDREGWLWTAEAQGDGTLVAISPEGQPVTVVVPGWSGRDIGAIAVSPDGVRIAVLSRESGLWRLSVFGLVRMADGTPTLAGTPLEVGVGVGASQAMEWVGEGQIAVLGSSNEGETPALLLVTIGGRTESIASVSDAVGLAARSSVNSLALITRDGSLFARSNSGWVRIDTVGELSSLAFSG
jgi:hypothetical protein